MSKNVLTAWNWMRTAIGVPLLIVILLTGSFFVYTLVRDFLRDSAVERQNKKIDEFVAQSQAAQEETLGHLAKWEADHATTVQLLDVIQQMSSNIKILADKDGVISLRVDGLNKSYESTRTQKSSGPGRVTVPMHERENDVLTADDELYR